MTTFQKLKHEARRAEQRSDWARAIDLYQRALDADEDMADLSLYNRIGDLHMRLGEAEAAVSYYERAVERYADNAMHTSAIALCNKILRIAPGRSSIYRRLALLHARTGLVAEGRGNMLAFVRQVVAEGRPEDADEAVTEFADTTGDDEVRLQSATELSEAGYVEAAAAQLRAVARTRSRRGEDVEELNRRIENLVQDGTSAEAAEAPASDASPEPTPRPQGPKRLAQLVARRLSERQSEAAFAADAPAADAPAADARTAHGDLPEVRRQADRFLSRVADVLETGDPTIRYDLGVEFMTIGLLDEAIREFQIAIAEPRLLDAANARIGECLALRDSEASFEVIRQASRAAPELREHASAPAAETAEVTVDEPTSEAVEAAPPSGATVAEPPEGHEGGEDDELQGHFFRARLAQYRIRQAEERHKVEHAAHLDLGAAYVEMGLYEEALREFGVALQGPRPVSGRAERALERLALGRNDVPELALKIVDRLAESGSEAAAERLTGVLDEAWGDQHPLAGALSERRDRLRSAVDELPALEDMFPSLVAATEPDRVAPARDASDAEADSTESVDRILLQVSDQVVAGELESAIAGLRESFARLEAARRTREALRVLERLLELQPDDTHLHHRRTELAAMANDQDLLLAAFAGLGACHRRHGVPAEARTAYGRMLDIDPSNELARQAIKRLDDSELELEHEASRSTAEPNDGEELEAMLEFLEGLGEAEVEVVTGSSEPDDYAVDELESDDDGDATARSRYELGQAFRQMGMWDEAVRELGPALDGVSDRLGVLEALGECLLKAGRPEQAIELLQSNLRTDEDAEQVAPLYFFGLALQAEGEEARAREVLGRVEAAHPGYRDTADRLSELSL